MASVKDRINQILIQDKLISQDNLNKALQIQKANGGRLSAILVEQGFISDDKLMSALAKLFEKPSIDISRFKIDPQVLKLIPVNICRKYQLIPISIFAETLTLAMADPLNILALDDIKSLTGYKINPIIADSKSIMRQIDEYYGDLSKGMIEDLVHGFSSGKLELIQQKKDAVISADELGRMIQEAPVVSFVNKLFEEGVAFKASDILIEPLEDKTRIRLRVDGTLREHAAALKTMHPFIISRIKVISGMDIAEHRLPQDGRFRMKLHGHEVDFRVSVLPSSRGEKVAVRVLDRSQVNLDIAKLGFQEKPLLALKRAAKLPHGMILVCGPTGSGKTTTLYSLLKFVDSPKVNIITVEDPVEFQLHGINQVNVQPDIGLTFASVLRAILRQDPNIIMVGEIRDFDTIDIAIKSALTGHLVFSTLHTTTAVGAVVRMVNMGIEPFLITSAVAAIVSQRLIRILCPDCKQPYELNAQAIKELNLPFLKDMPKSLFKPKGCSQCFNSGYIGRLIIAEVLSLTPKIRDLILIRALEDDIKEAARQEGMQTLREDGLLKCYAGTTSLEEVMRVTPADE